MTTLTTEQALELLRGELKQAALQIEYLHRKFAETGSGNGTLAQINQALSDTAPDKVAPAVPDDRVMITRKLATFLMGESALDGVCFGERLPNRVGTFWWRKYLHECIAGAQQETKK